DHVNGGIGGDAGGRIAVTAALEPVPIAGGERDGIAAADGVRLVAAVPGPGVLDGAGLRRVDEVPAVVAVPPGAAAVEDVAGVAGLVRVAAEAVGALPVAVRGHGVLVLVRVAIEKGVVAAGLQEEAGPHVVVRIDELELVVAPAGDVDAPRFVVVGVELQRAGDLQPLEI